MLMNNLDPEVAERPDDLIVYGGSGRAARSWAAFDAIVATLRRLEHDETLVVQSGKPVAVFRTHPWAPRVLIANALLVPAWATWDTLPRSRGPRPDDVRPDDGRQLDLHRHAGHPAGHLRDARRARAPALRRHARRPPGRHRRSRRHGRRPAARRHDERRDRARRRGRSRSASSAGWRRATSTSAPALSTTRSRASSAAGAAGDARSIALEGNAADVLPELVRRGIIPDVVTDQTSAHDALNGYVPNGLSLAEADALRRDEPGRVRARARWRRWRRTSARCSTLQARGAVTFDYGNNIRAQAEKAGVADAFEIPGFVPEYIRPLFCEGKGPFRWAALSGDPADIAATDALALEMFADDAAALPLDPAGRASASRSRDCRRASSGSATASARASASRSTIWCAAASSRRRSSSAAIISTPARSPRPTARPRACATAATPSPTGPS